ncbi:Predicted arabinose efflux permease, MFS family [Jatrophihabitans endophyticus]|uniref:Predicted arabinose efflux permease, MFS family n=1 Tax=Jatrophihabitans endophyticus TaxID=1206085 RepID=A0A1M5EQT7_9ACTN|nr:Predicted arabinose efflux permease, MFS family [Jatrophihabitans endophyticus]
MSAASAAAGVRGRDFRLLWFGETTSALGASVTGLALPLVALAVLDAGVVAVGVLEAVTWLPWLVIGLPAGAWVDRLSRRRVMIGCDVVSLVAFASVPVAAALGVLSLAQLVLVAAVAGTANVFFTAAYRALIPAVAGPEELVGANARLQGAESAARVAGPGLGGLLAQAFGAANALLADAVSFAVSLGCLLRMRVAEAPRRSEPSVPSGPRPALRREIGDGLRFVWGDQLLRSLAGFGALANLTLSASNVLIIAFLVHDVGASAGTAGLLLALGGVGGVLGAAAVPSLTRRLGTGRALVASMLAAPPAALLVPLAASGWPVVLFVLGELGLVAAVVAGNIVRAGFVQRYCPAGLLGRVTASQQVVNYGTIPIGAVVGGVLGAATGPRTALLVVFAAYLASNGLLAASPLRGLRELPTRAGNLSDGAGSIGDRADQRARDGRGGGRSGPRRARSRAARGRGRGARAGLHPGRRRHRQDPGDHPPHRLRRAQRCRARGPAAGRHLHRPRRR